MTFRIHVSSNPLSRSQLINVDYFSADLIPPMYETALAKCPGNEDYMTHLFMSYVRMGKPKEMQRVSVTKHPNPTNPHPSLILVRSCLGIGLPIMS